MIVKKNVLALVVLVVIVLGASFIFLSSFDTTPERLSTPTPDIIEQSSATNLLYGLPIAGFNIETNAVKRNEFLSDILQRYQVDLQSISILANKSKAIFDVRKIGAGHDYTVFADNAGKAAYFIYQPNPIDYVVYDLRDSISIYKRQKEVDTKIESVSGTIQSSLYETLEANGASPDLAVQLAEIYGWAVNFYRINRNDWFKLVYERKYVDGKPIGPGRIRSAVFGHDGKEYQAFYFEPKDGQPGAYYDENGKSLRRTFLKAPLKYSRISSRFTMRRFHPVQRRWKAHLGTDFAAPHGTPIVATAAGVIIDSRYSGGNGNYVKIKHDNVYTTQYLHMSKRAVKKGQRVSQGQVIGYVGSTGLATGPHVCYRFWKNGRQVDALAQVFPPSEPIKREYQIAFERTLNEGQQRLAAIGDQKQSNLEIYGALAFRIENLFEPETDDNRILEGFSAQML
ncbi:M23 family metallopeptidase [Parapedobacter indicus]|uniref:Murein DD-endopeptidase MepM and murein hydrolase activator NlpD, contain LysM domain n=1 Tax=Parapedobacter indicus TaxID=1477437 RepID=A0A1I3UWE4_9SPHI|nr:peptidoglycan DD-metalloendopeptidase family protein [Parapedobacter indicus]PPK99060.1 murein DD-endopeptidase MepM/ murein hydrolase activator NlpD [Parapedobacter indicus]SFJ87220.1 Murein DD-endopeptidase MepM and murein hydrolase activator NlpD, contain LysM domain [Parapedobacter indicus]